MLRLAESAGSSAQEFIDEYRGSELDPTGSSASRSCPATRLEAVRHTSTRRGRGGARADGATSATDAGLPISEFRRIVPRAARRARGPPGQEGDGRGEPAARDLDRQEVHQPRPAVPRPDPGGQHRPDEGGRQVRVPPRLQVLDLCHLVDPPGDHPLHRRPGAHHPHPGAHDRDDQQAGPHLAPDAARDRPRADAGGAGREARHAAGEGPQGPEDRQGADQPRDADRRRGGQPSRRLHRGQERRSCRSMPPSRPTCARPPRACWPP